LGAPEKNGGSKNSNKLIGENQRSMANNFQASGNNVTKLVHVVCCAAEVNILVEMFWGLKLTFNFFRCTNRRDFRKYLRNWSRYRQAENGVIN